MTETDSKTEISIHDTVEIPNGNDAATEIISTDTNKIAGIVGVDGPVDESILNAVKQPDWTSMEDSFSHLNFIGMGGMGTVFSAKDSLFFRNVALKIMRPELRNQNKRLKAFIREARITAQIDHPNIVPVYNLGIFKEMGAYFSMKKVDGITLAEILRKLEQNDEVFEKEYSLRRRLEIFISICNGVAFAHSKGVIHCDLKPGNIMVGDYGEVFIMDWGMAVYRSEKDLSSRNRKINLGEESQPSVSDGKNTSETINGTPAFMAPEQIFGRQGEIDEQTDVYALGVILYTILTCTQSPFPAGLSSEKIFDCALSGNFQPPRKRARKRRISRELEIVCLKAMSPYKNERYSDVMALMQDIRNILDMHPVEVYNSPLLNFIKYCRRHPMIPTALVGAGITLGVFYSYFSISNLLTANALKQVLATVVDNNTAVYNRYLGELKHSYGSDDIEHKYNPFYDENKDFEIKNIVTKLDLSCSQIIDALFKINEVTESSRFLPVVEKALELYVNYSVLSGNSENINKIRQMDSGIVYEAYRRLIKNDTQLRRKLQLIAISSGILDFNTGDDTLEIFISRQISQDNEDFFTQEKDDENNKELMLRQGSFSVSLKDGEYSLLVSDQKGRNISIPVVIKSGEHCVIDFEFPAVIPEDCVYIHEGYYFSNISNHYSIGREVYVGSFFLLDREVTIGEYLKFWKTVLSPELKQKYNPDLLFYHNGAFFMEKLFSAGGKVLPPYNEKMPLVGVSAEGARAFCEYMSAKTGMKCRLPYFMELEKAARGTGRRLFTWGNRFNADYALLSVNPQISQFAFGAPPKTFSHDYSLYGVYDLTGNVRELVQLKKRTYDDYAVYGGSYKNTANYAKCGTLSRFAENRTDVGMRYVIELPEKNSPKSDESGKNIEKSVL